MILRAMVEGDAKKAAALDLAMGTPPWSSGMFLEELRLGSHCRVLVGPQGDLAGFLVARPQFDEWHIMTLGVARTLRRQGWGRRLVENLLEEADQAGCPKLLLEVRRSNVGAQALYRALGFTLLHTRRNYYATRQGREDALVMTYCCGRG
ncbi:MAG: ribosomal protein S18-alanine N-acetyltransferase [Magnetococcales bacterium]|nr:ribosomal protein S18-alanine N-acetyltransferase [Magnetococcales bacterium]